MAINPNRVIGYRLESAGATDVGRKRQLNEDVFLADESLGLYLVADGMGGHAAGEVASRLAADEIFSTLGGRGGSVEETWPEHWDRDRSVTANLLVDAILSGHERVTNAVNRDTNLKGMGTTVVVAVHPPASRHLVVCHVGDSRAYRWRRSQLEILTEDHSWVHEQVAAGFLSEEAARNHPLKNVVTQALGGSAEPKVDILETEMMHGDLYMLCSDGLNSMLTDQEIADFLARADNLDECAGRLIDAANERGGNDNVTVVLLRACQITPKA
ncbi:MAG TPA: Stp1/IreP family PP2C-type Ser/Thr phosphatase [Candidatus Sulfomarinibacteraceae bacterium]|nr:Stp1/IreP family PP2C-type Ser/Thr phosphatase [Candidatus Sulfomarinibacteraceae bacterium]